MSESQTSRFPVWGQFEFRGKASEYFAIWIVNMALTILTLGIYSAWAKVRRERFFYGNTVVHGSHFEYTADPLIVLRGRILAVVLFGLLYAVLLIYPQWGLFAIAGFILVFPFMVVTSTSFRLRNTRYRNIRFRFDRDFVGAYRLFLIPLGAALLLTALLYGAWEGSEFALEVERQVEQSGEQEEFRSEDMLLTIFIFVSLPITPYIQYLLRRFLVDRAHFGNADGVFHATAGSFYMVYILLFLLSVTVMIVLAALAGLLASVFALAPEVATGEEADMSSAIAMMVPMFMSFYVIGFYLMGYLNSRLANLTWNNARLGPLELSSTQRARDLGTIYLTNTLAIIFSLGLAIPWSQIRLARYKAARLEILAQDLEAVKAIAVGDPDAVGEELGEVFDLDLGL